MKILDQVATDDDYRDLQQELADNPEKGDVIPGAGGARKVRMALGARVDLTKDEKKEIAAYIRILKGA